MSGEVLFEQKSTNGTINGHEFDSIVGFLEEILVDESFVQTQSDFFQKHAGNFTESEENKLEYMEVFQEYMEIVETHIENRLTANFEKLSMAEVARALIERADEVTEDVIEMLESLADFQEFKVTILSYKNGVSLDVLPS